MTEDRLLSNLAAEERRQREQAERAIQAVDADDANALGEALGCTLEEAEALLAKLRPPSRNVREAWLRFWALLGRSWPIGGQGREE